MSIWKTHVDVVDSWQLNVVESKTLIWCILQTHCEPIVTEILASAFPPQSVEDSSLTKIISSTHSSMNPKRPCEDWGVLPGH